ncbi:MAG: F0F1 ATP synthase subunit B [Patescibacteria group bacterium]
MSEILGKIGFDWHVALANLVNFLIILFVLKRYAFKPISKMIKDRQEIMVKGIQDAKENALLLKSAKEEYEKTLSKARIEANEIFEKNKKENEKRKTEMMEQTQKEMVVTIENGKKALESEKIKMLNEVKNEVAGLVLQATEKVMGEKNK